MRQKRSLIDQEHSNLSIQRQCELLGLSRSSYYYVPCVESPLNLKLMRLIDEEHLNYPFYGYPRMCLHLSKKTGQNLNEKRIYRLMKKMRIRAIFPIPKTTIAAKGHTIYPYLLRDLRISRPNQVWSTDITYIPMARGFLYLAAVIDWYSRFVLSWTLSNNMERWFCIEALENAFEFGQPEIFNTDQGSQFTSHDFTAKLLARNINISMDGRGRALDNVFVERLWWSVKYEKVYLNEYQNGAELYKALKEYFHFYNNQRPHSSLNNYTPTQIYARPHLLD